MEKAPLVAVYGPFSEEKWGGGIRWLFSGLRGDGSWAAWRLRFTFHDRSWSVRATSKDQTREYSRAMAEGQESILVAAMDLDKMLAIKGKITDVLLQRLPPETLAEATAGLISYQRRASSWA